MLKWLRSRVVNEADMKLPKMVRQWSLTNNTQQKASTLIATQNYSKIKLVMIKSKLPLRLKL